MIADYLPEQLIAPRRSTPWCARRVDELGVRDDGMQAMGRVMGVLTPKTKGRADGGAVAAAVRRGELWCRFDAQA